MSHTGTLFCEQCVLDWIAISHRPLNGGGPAQCTPILFTKAEYEERDKFIARVIEKNRLLVGRTEPGEASAPTEAKP